MKWDFPLGAWKPQTPSVGRSHMSIRYVITTCSPTAFLWQISDCPACPSCLRFRNPWSGAQHYHYKLFSCTTDPNPTPRKPKCCINAAILAELTGWPLQSKYSLSREILSRIFRPLKITDWIQLPKLQKCPFLQTPWEHTSTPAFRQFWKDTTIFGLYDY